jgi:hypothetical protein
VARKIAGLFVPLLLTTLLVSKVARHLFHIQIVWVYAVALVAFAVGTVVLARRHRRT